MAVRSSSSNERRGLRLASGFLFTAFLIISLFSYHAYNLTTLEMVEKIGVAATHDMLNVQPLVDFSYPELMKLAELNPDTDITIPGLGVNLGIKAKELKGVPKDQVGEYIIRVLIKRVYNEGFSKVFNTANLPGVQSGLSDTGQTDLARFIGLADTFVNKDFNNLMHLIFFVATLLTILLAIPLFLLSPGFTKLTSFGGSFLTAGVPGFAFFLMRLALGPQWQVGSSSSDSLGGTLLPFIEKVQLSYLAVFLLGVGLLLAGMSGIFITRGKHNKRQA